MKKFGLMVMLLTLAVAIFAGCGSENSDGQSAAINVVSREDGSGTRGAFTELFGIEVKDESGEKVDQTLASTEITNSTAVMMNTIIGNVNAIGYISLGSLNDTVKALDIDGVAASAENVKNGTYAVSRPFNIVTKGEVNELAQDFINFILSAQGQAVVEENGYISEGNQGDYTSATPQGKIVVAGSSSVTPVMEKLKEAYLELNPQAKIEVQQSDSSIGVSSVIEGVCDIGMASRELKDSEASQGVTSTVIAKDGIAVIVNNDNQLNGLTSEQVRMIFIGEISDWFEVE